MKTVLLAALLMVQPQTPNKPVRTGGIEDYRSGNMAIIQYDQRKPAEAPAK